jgi:uncharacterized protein (TIGR02246 family)
MNPTRIIIVTAFTILALSISISAQKKPASTASVEQTIRALDLDAARAVLNHDEKAIALYFAPNSVTNNPRNGLTRGSTGVIEATKTGPADYYKFERVVESVQVLGNTAITMGSESIVMKNERGEAGRAYDRRYTNVWMKNGKRWQIVARHASVICP